MTFHYVYIIDLDLFTIKKDVLTTGDIDYEIVLKVKKNIPKEKYLRNRHYFWHE